MFCCKKNGKCTGSSRSTSGFTPIIHVRTSKVPCKMTKINWKMGKKTGGEKQEEPPFLERGDAEVVLNHPNQFF